MKQFFQFILILLTLGSCKEVFDRPPQSLTQVNLYGKDDLAAQSTLVSVQGLGLDSIWIDGESVSSFRLPLSDKSDTSVFVLLMDSVADTIMIRYNSQLVYESMESGFYTEHYLQWLRCTSNKIDSISLIDTLVISIWHENIQLFLNDSSALTGSN